MKKKKDKKNEDSPKRKLEEVEVQDSTEPKTKKTIPYYPKRGLSCRDLIGIAATGSGKTLAFGIPAMMHVLGKRKGKASKGRNPLCLVLSPTRELAQQISDVMCDAGTSCGVESICLYGGTSKGPQISSLKSGIVSCSDLPLSMNRLHADATCRVVVTWPFAFSINYVSIYVLIIHFVWDALPIPFLHPALEVRRMRRQRIGCDGEEADKRIRR
ncbi:hypothetical protein K1719_026644 [Acacia pycnantha]|nr:hypothetical protein K1719_026644 [Acacia pycnantha]